MQLGNWTKTTKAPGTKVQLCEGSVSISHEHFPFLNQWFFSSKYIRNSNPPQEWAQSPENQNCPAHASNRLPSRSRDQDSDSSVDHAQSGGKTEASGMQPQVLGERTWIQWWALSCLSHSTRTKRENCIRQVKQARETLFETLVIEETDLNLTLLEQQREWWQGPGELWG